jgi:anti-sigma factor RsiW
MTPERFRRITESYGASPGRWPADERDAARALLDARDPEALAALTEARALDGLLNEHAVRAPSDDLMKRIIASVPSRPRPRPFWRRPRVWFSGVGFVGAGAAGVIAGALLVSMLAATPVSHSRFDQTYPGTAFGGAPDEWSDQ